MAGSVNKVILIGNLGADPEIKRTQDGRRGRQRRRAPGRAQQVQPYRAKTFSSYCPQLFRSGLNSSAAASGDPISEAIIVRSIRKCRLSNATVAGEVNPPEADDLLGLIGNLMELLDLRNRVRLPAAPRYRHRCRMPGTKLEHFSRECYMWITREIPRDRQACASGERIGSAQGSPKGS